LGLGDLPDEVAEVIERMQAYILGIIDRIVGFLVTQARALLRRLGVGGEEHPEEDPHHNADDELGTTVRFSGGHESHRLWISREGDHAVAMVASGAAPVTAKIEEWRGMLTGADDPRNGLIASIDSSVAALNGDAEALAHAFNEAVQDPQDDKEPPDDSAVEGEERSLASLLRQAFDDFGQASERALLQAISSALATGIPGLIGGSAGALSTFLVDSKHIPQGTSQAAAVWPDRSGAEAGAAAAANGVATDSTHNRPLLEYFTAPPKQPEAASEPAFWTWALTHGGESDSVGGRVRSAYGHAYVAGLKATPVTGQDPVDQPLSAAINAMGWAATGAAAGEVTGPPKLPESTDPPLRQRVSGRIVPFLRDIAEARSSDGYSYERLRWAWVSHPPSKDYLAGAFRDVDGGGQHEWIPTGEFIRVVERAVETTGFAPSGTRIGVQWINLFHYLRTDTNRVYWRVLRPPRITAQTTPGTRQMAEARVGMHVGSAINPNTENSGGGTIGTKAFHDALRTAFRAAELTTPTDYIQSLLWVVADVLWDGELTSTNVPPPVWDEPIDLWFTINGPIRSVGMTLRMLAERQVENIDIIDQDFNRARANLG
jgi:hypothetical protein